MQIKTTITINYYIIKFLFDETHKMVPNELTNEESMTRHILGIAVIRAKTIIF